MVTPPFDHLPDPDPGKPWLFPSDINVQYIAGHVRLSPQLARELYEQRIGPLHGPEIPMPWSLWRELGGHPAGPYRRGVPSCK